MFQAAASELARSFRRVRPVSLVRTWLGTRITLLAALWAAGSYGHARAGFLGSLVAAVVEATAVVFGRVFGPALELRAPPLFS